MNNTAIQVNNLSKKYYIGRTAVPYKTIRETLTNVAKAPFNRIADLFKGHAYGAVEMDTEIWALKDVSFEVKEGEVIGIVGHNGAGKSTLLKILSRITEPTKGRVEIRGSVGSLLEVGTGFHPELSGRENIFLNGAILGMGKKEMHRKFDEIVDFSEIGKFIDTPVKYYSTGMYVRLAFSVAAYLEPEILLVDEVLAVGDFAFQKKCLGKMRDVAGGGKTVLFVSHNMSAVRALCSKTILLEQGSLETFGASQEVIDQYLDNAYQKENLQTKITYEDKDADAQIKEIRIFNNKGIAGNRFKNSEEIRFEILYEIKKAQSSLYVGIQIMSAQNDAVLFTVEDVASDPNLLIKREPGKYVMKFSIPPYLLNEGRYSFRGFMVPGRVGVRKAYFVPGFVFDCYLEDAAPSAFIYYTNKGCLDLRINTRTEKIG